MPNNNFKNRIVYQIYPLSFKDSNNDGIGDLNGIISKLDYLKKLGVGYLWLSPIYASSFKDNGYDISDYYQINKVFGSMEDFENLIKEANKRNIDIIMDLVVNHTSSDHYWFQEALKDKNSKYRDYYYFRKGKGKRPPNNWNSSFSGSCWEKVPNEDNMYYLHLYTSDQPDLNYHNEEVIQEVEKILKFYLDKGVKGFRCDVINQIYKTSLANGKFRFFNRGKEHYESQEGNFKILERFRKEVLDKYDAFLVGETSNITPKIGNQFLKRRCLDMFFEFEHAFCDMNKIAPIFKRKFKPQMLIKPLFKWQEEVSWIALYLENHDQRRSINRYGNINEFYTSSAKALSMLLLSLKGTPFIYQGQEIGMCDYLDYSLSDLDDCLSKMALKSATSILKISKERAFKLIHKTINRDNSRSPFQWDNSFNAGFNEGHKTWLKVNSSFQQGINVKEEEQDSDSILKFYQKMIHLRNSNKTLQTGEFIRIKSNRNIAKFYRKSEDETLLIVINLSKKIIKDKRYNSNILISNYKDVSPKVLLPYQGVIYKIK